MPLVPNSIVRLKMDGKLKLGVFTGREEMNYMHTSRGYQYTKVYQILPCFYSPEQFDIVVKWVTLDHIAVALTPEEEKEVKQQQIELTCLNLQLRQPFYAKKKIKTKLPNWVASEKRKAELMDLFSWTAP